MRKPLSKYIYKWPYVGALEAPVWSASILAEYLERAMPEPPDEVAKDSRWPAFFSQPICVVTTVSGEKIYLEREVGPCIVNRFPYVMTLSLCRSALSDRHSPRSQFMKAMEESRVANVQFLTLGPALDRCMAAINDVPEGRAEHRMAATGLDYRAALSNAAPVFSDAFMVYEARLCDPMQDLYGHQIYQKPYTDVGSHRLYYLEVNCIQLRKDIADGQKQIEWTSLAEWESPSGVSIAKPADRSMIERMAYVKPFTPYYQFPSANTISFEYEGTSNGMAFKHLEPFRRTNVNEIDNDKTRWPCFFPSSLGMITSRSADGQPNVMPCGSTTVVSRSPFVISPAVTYGGINDRYRARHTLHNIRETGWFGCGLPTVSEDIITAIRYAGNISVTEDPNKLEHTGLIFEDGEYAPILKACPIHFDCKVVDEVKLGTHSMFLGEVRRILVRKGVTADNTISWNPWPVVWGESGTSLS